MQLQYAAFSVMYWFFFLLNCHNNAIQNMKWKFPTNISLLETKLTQTLHIYLKVTVLENSMLIILIYKIEAQKLDKHQNVLQYTAKEASKTIMHDWTPLSQSVPYHLKELLHFIHITYWYMLILSPSIPNSWKPWSERPLNS